MAPRKERALDAVQLLVLLVDAAREFARKVLRQRLVDANALPADLKLEALRYARMAILELDRELVGRQEGGAEVVVLRQAPRP